MYQCVRGTDIKARYRVVSQNVPKFAEQTFYGTVLSRTDLNTFQSHLEMMWDGFDDPEVVMVTWIEASGYDPEKAVMGLAPLFRAKAEPKVRSSGACTPRSTPQGRQTLTLHALGGRSWAKSSTCQSTRTASGTPART